MSLKISRMGLWKINKRYETDGDYGLKDHNLGRHLTRPCRSPAKNNAKSFRLFRKFFKNKQVF